MTEFSDYIIYADESGDPHLAKINPEFPMFCLALCIIKKSDYIEYITPAIQRLKFDYWGHDKVVLHEHEMRKQTDDFAFLRSDRALREGFLERVSQIMANAPFHVASCVIQKENLRNQYSDPFNPYDIALKMCMENLLAFLLREGEEGKKVTCVFERRGKQEDEQLELEFYRIVNNQNTWGYIQKDFSKIEFEIKFAGKSHNSTGLQLADLIARPLALRKLRPEQDNRAYDIIAQKFIGGGYKSFP
ncbi:MAG: hypothetical protein CBB87_05085 [Micavibrio sp. TMED27]|nr:hypothetical protein [Micavibrio sp.]OUT91403.1 MAG: hypothetical protein CBB87_05085 [Micavibrio sp. TMED27]|tara:strand:- start:544 stop:1281 length:738 start_codon:yes stop_codon:yes gene_type:complete